MKYLLNFKIFEGAIDTLLDKYKKENITIDPSDLDYFKKLTKKLPNNLYKLVKWMLEGEYPEDVSVVYNHYLDLRNKNIKVPDINRFSKLEELSDELDIIERNFIINKIVQELPSNLKKEYKSLNNDDKLRPNHLFVKLYHSNTKDQLISKISRYKNLNDLLDIIESFLSSNSKGYKDILISIQNDNSTNLLYHKNNIIVAEILRYESSCKLGSKSWCISTQKYQFDNYTDYGKDNQYFIWDFNLNESNPLSLIGLTLYSENNDISNLNNLNTNLNIRAAHDRLDSDISYKIIDILKNKKIDLSIFGNFNKDNYLEYLQSIIHDKQPRVIYDIISKRNNLLVLIDNNILDKLINYIIEYKDIKYIIELNAMILNNRNYIFDEYNKYFDNNFDETTLKNYLNNGIKLNDNNDFLEFIYLLIIKYGYIFQSFKYFNEYSEKKILNYLLLNNINGLFKLGLFKFKFKSYYEHINKYINENNDYNKFTIIIKEYHNYNDLFKNNIKKEELYLKYLLNNDRKFLWRLNSHHINNSELLEKYFILSLSKLNTIDKIKFLNGERYTDEGFNHYLTTNNQIKLKELISKDIDNSDIDTKFDILYNWEIVGKFPRKLKPMFLDIINNYKEFNNPMNKVKALGYLKKTYEMSKYFKDVELNEENIKKISYYSYYVPKVKYRKEYLDNLFLFIDKIPKKYNHLISTFINKKTIKYYGERIVELFNIIDKKDNNDAIIKLINETDESNYDPLSLKLRNLISDKISFPYIKKNIETGKYVNNFDRIFYLTMKNSSPKTIEKNIDILDKYINENISYDHNFMKIILQIGNDDIIRKYINIMNFNRKGKNDLNELIFITFESRRMDIDIFKEVIRNFIKYYEFNTSLYNIMLYHFFKINGDIEKFKYIVSLLLEKFSIDEIHLKISTINIFNIKINILKKYISYLNSIKKIPSNLLEYIINEMSRFSFNSNDKKYFQNMIKENENE